MFPGRGGRAELSVDAQLPPCFLEGPEVPVQGQPFDTQSVTALSQGIRGEDPGLAQGAGSGVKAQFVAELQPGLPVGRDKAPRGYFGRDLELENACRDARVGVGGAQIISSVRR